MIFMWRINYKGLTLTTGVDHGLHEHLGENAPSLGCLETRLSQSKQFFKRAMEAIEALGSEDSPPQG
jgi:hypothetical protein